MQKPGSIAQVSRRKQIVYTNWSINYICYFNKIIIL